MVGLLILIRFLKICHVLPCLLRPSSTSPSVRQNTGKRPKNKSKSPNKHYGARSRAGYRRPASFFSFPLRSTTITAIDFVTDADDDAAAVANIFLFSVVVFCISLLSLFLCLMTIFLFPFFTLDRGLFALELYSRSFRLRDLFCFIFVSHFVNSTLTLTHTHTGARGSN